MKRSSEAPSLLWKDNLTGFRAPRQMSWQRHPTLPGPRQPPLQGTAGPFAGKQPHLEAIRPWHSGGRRVGAPWSRSLLEPLEPSVGRQKPLPGRHPMISARPQGRDSRPPPGASGGDGQGQDGQGRDGGCQPRPRAPPTSLASPALPASPHPRVPRKGSAHPGSGPRCLGPFSQRSPPPGQMQAARARGPASPCAMGPAPSPGTPRPLSLLCPVPLTLSPLIPLMNSQGWEGRGLLLAPRWCRGRQGLGSCLLGFELLSGLC